jgi:hypothetical protein
MECGLADEMGLGRIVFCALDIRGLVFLSLALFLSVALFLSIALACHCLRFSLSSLTKFNEQQRKC